LRRGRMSRISYVARPDRAAPPYPTPRRPGQKPNLKQYSRPRATSPYLGSFFLQQLRSAKESPKTVGRWFSQRRHPLLNQRREPSQQFFKLVLVDQEIDRGCQRRRYQNPIPHGQSPARLLLATMCIQFHELSIFDVRLLVSNSPSRLVLEIDIGERLAVGVADDEAGIAAFTAPGETKAPTRA